MGIKKSSLIAAFLFTAVVIIVLIGINQILISGYIERIILQNHESIAEQMLTLARRGIYDYLNSMQSDLNFISRMSDIEEFNGEGRVIIRKFYLNYSDVFSNVTRLDSSGNIVYTYPEDEKAVGENVMYQYHNKRLFNERKPVISAPFLAVQDYRAIALAHPVFSGTRFTGSITGLMRFNRIWEMYISKLNITPNTFFIVINESGRLVYSPPHMDVNRLENILSENYFNTSGMPDNCSADFIFSNAPVSGAYLKEKYFAARIGLEVQNNKWCIYAMIPESDIKMSTADISRSQHIFIYLILILFFIMSIIFLLYHNYIISRRMADSRERSIEQHDLSTDIIIYSLSRDYPFFICSDKSQIITSSSPKEITGMHTEAVLSECSALKKIGKLGAGECMELTCRVSQAGSVHDMNYKACRRETDTGSIYIFAGLPEDDDHTDSELYEEMEEWYFHREPAVITDTRGNILMRNRLFEKRFPAIHNTAGIDFKSGSFMSSVRQLKDKRKAVSSRCTIDSLPYNIQMTPLYNSGNSINYILITVSSL
ncbi:MAG: cache domain-containing protein [bacterium]